MNKKTDKYLVYGLGISGLEAALLLNRHGKSVEVIDNNDGKILQQRKQILQKNNIEVTLDYTDDISPDKYKEIIISPGIDARDNRNLLSNKVISEVELAYRYLSGDLISVTGSNGKSTTVSLLGRIFKDAQKESFVAGNIGNPLAAISDKTEEDYVTIVELSSFQLEKIKHYKSQIALLLNLTPDHLDRYDSIDDYYRTKMRIFENQTKDDFAIINGDDQDIARYIEGIDSRIIRFSMTGPKRPGIWLEGDTIKFDLKDLGISKFQKEQKLIDTDGLRIPGPHNIANAMAASVAALISGIGIPSLVKSLCEFRGIPHRIEYIRTLDGVEYYNDSKSTNIDSLKYAMMSFKRPFILIAGGYDKKASFEVLRQYLPENLKKIILIGQTAEKIEKAFGDLVDCTKENSLREAAIEARQVSKAGDSVLLSPGCASFDMFDNFEDRGDKFKQIVMELD
ncbi:MAG: UDP-N-acetylmuramoyl-L-alanine--D-glutamate ligase [Candidatus Zixiibacteriota bacterium]